jgi:hypothetical protein
MGLLEYELSKSSSSRELLAPVDAGGVVVEAFDVVVLVLGNERASKPRVSIMVLAVVSVVRQRSTESKCKAWPHTLWIRSIRHMTTLSFDKEAANKVCKLGLGICRQGSLPISWSSALVSRRISHGHLAARPWYQTQYTYVLITNRSMDLYSGSTHGAMVSMLVCACVAVSFNVMVIGM